LPNELAVRIAALDAAGLVLLASVEAEIAQLDATEQAAFLRDPGLHESALARFIRAAYALLDLISFFTVGADEVRAWPIRRGTTARLRPAGFILIWSAASFARRWYRTRPS
jgi:ribosome-binding ATPase YchF (GTP1/OBG family)